VRHGSVAMGIASILCGLMLSSCASTVMTGSWKDPAYSSGPFKKLMVVGVAKREVMRRSFENSFATQLQLHGVQGIPSGTFSPGTEQLDKDAMAAKLAELGCDGVLITRLVDQRTKTTYYPPTGYAVPVAYRAGYYAYYTGAYAIAYSPGYTEESTTVSLETNLYDARTGSLVWTGLTDTELYGDPFAQVEEFVGIVVKEMAGETLLHSLGRLPTIPAAGALAGVRRHRCRLRKCPRSVPTPAAHRTLRQPVGAMRAPA